MATLTSVDFPVLAGQGSWVRSQTKGHALFTERCESLKLSVANVAQRLKLSRQAVHIWTSDWGLPSPSTMAQLEDWLGIPMRAWTEPAEQEKQP